MNITKNSPKIKQNTRNNPKKIEKNFKKYPKQKHRKNPWSLKNYPKQKTPKIGINSKKPQGHLKNETPKSIQFERIKKLTRKVDIQSCFLLRLRP